MEVIEHVREVHHLHVWQLDEHHRALEAHVVLEAKNLDQLEAIKYALKQMLQARFDIGHSTLEFETSTAYHHDRQTISPH